MNDAQKIQRWQRCQSAAERLGLIIGTHATGSNSYFYVRTNKNFYHPAPTLDALWGFLNGMEAAKGRKRNQPK